MIFQSIKHTCMNLIVAHMDFVCNIDECSADKTYDRYYENSEAHVLFSSFVVYFAKIHKTDHIFKSISITTNTSEILDMTIIRGFIPYTNVNII